MPNLERMTLRELQDLAEALSSIHEIGKEFAEDGLSPVFDLTLGQSPIIQLAGYTMPHAWTADESEFNAARDDFAQDLPAMQDDLIQKVRAFTATTYPDWPEHRPSAVKIEISPAAPPPAADEAAPDQPEQTAASPAGAETGAEGGGERLAAPAPAAYQNPQTGPSWSTEETARLVQLVVEGIMAGKSKRAATMAAADVLGRPHEGTAFRLRTKAAAAFEAALKAATSKVFEAAEKTEILGGEPGGLQREYLAENAPASPAAQQRAQADVQAQAAAGDGQAQADLDPAILRHLDQMPATSAGAKWPPKVDLDLVDAAARGLSVPEIATDLRLRADQAKLRLALLLGRFSAKDVLRHMQAAKGK